MPDASNITITETELRQIVREEMQVALGNRVTLDELHQALNDRPTRQDITSLIQTQINAANNPIVEELQTIIRSFSDRFAAIEQLLAAIGEQSRNQSEWMRTVKDEQKRLDDEMGDIRHETGMVQLEQARQKGEQTALIQHIFGDPNRKGTTSLADTILQIKQSLDMTRAEIGVQLDQLNKTTCEALQPIQENIAEIKAAVEINTQFRLNRQRIEAVVLRVIPKASKRLWEGMTSELVIKALKWSLIPLGLSVIGALLERLQ